MAELSQDQMDRRAALRKGATTWGVIVGAVAGLLALWLLGGQGAALRFGGAVVVALALGYGAFRASFNAQARDARCGACGAAFSRSRTDRTETLAASTPREEREEQEDKSVKVTTWTEETFDVVDTYTCARCGDVTRTEYRTTRRRDETTRVDPAPVPKGWARTEPEKASAADPADAGADRPTQGAATAKSGGWSAPAPEPEAGRTEPPRDRGRRR